MQEDIIVLLHDTDNAGDEGVWVLVFLGTGVQVHASLLKHHLEMGTSEGRGPGAGRHPPEGGAQRGANGRRPREELFAKGRARGTIT